MRLAQGSSMQTAGTPGSAPLTEAGGQGAAGGVGNQVWFRPRWPPHAGESGSLTRVAWEARDGGSEAGEARGALNQGGDGQKDKKQ